MANYPMPAWLNPLGDPGELYLQSQRLNATVQEAQQRLAEQHDQAVMENQIRQDAVQQRAMESQQRLAVEQARLDTYAGMRQQSLDIAREKANTTAQNAARQFASQQELARRIGEEGPQNAAKIALSIPGLGLPGSGISSLARATTPPPDVNMEPQWTMDPESGKLIGYNRRTGTPHYRQLGANIPPGAVTQRERMEEQYLKAQIPALDKQLNDPFVRRDLMRSDEDIQALPKDAQAGAMKRRAAAQALQDQRSQVQSQIEAIIHPPQAGAATLPPGVAPAPAAAAPAAPVSLATQKTARANQLATQHPGWTKKKILDQIAKEFP